MNAHERIIRNALDAAMTHGAAYGKGGKAAAKVYREGELDEEIMLYMIAVMANGLVDLEQA